MGGAKDKKWRNFCCSAVRKLLLVVSGPVPKFRGRGGPWKITLDSPNLVTLQNSVGWSTTRTYAGIPSINFRSEFWPTMALKSLKFFKFERNIHDAGCNVSPQNSWYTDQQHLSVNRSTIWGTRRTAHITTIDGCDDCISRDSMTFIRCSKSSTFLDIARTLMVSALTNEIFFRSSSVNRGN